MTSLPFQFDKLFPLTSIYIVLAFADILYEQITEWEKNAVTFFLKQKVFLSIPLIPLKAL